MIINFQFVNENRPYIFSCCLLFTIPAIFTLYYDKIAIFIFLNTLHNRWLDLVMQFITNCGTGFFTLIVLSVACVTKNWKLAGNILVTFLLSGILVQGLKHLYQAPRPKAIISSDIYAYFFEGITHSGLTSFPSGHATTIFTLATVLAFSCKTKYISLVYFFFAALVAYSRIYLGQHFMEDVLAGGMLGTLSTLIVYILPKSLYAFPSGRVLPTKQLFDQWISNLR